MQILQLYDVSRIIEEPFVSWIRDQRLITERPIDIIAKIWSGAYVVFVAMDHIGMPHGMIVCAISGTKCTTILIHGKGQVLKLRDTFYKMLSDDYGCHEVCTYSHNRSVAYERLTGMKHVYSFYRRDL